MVNRSTSNPKQGNTTAASSNDCTIAPSVNLLDYWRSKQKNDKEIRPTDIIAEYWRGQYGSAYPYKQNGIERKKVVNILPYQNGDNCQTISKGSRPPSPFKGKSKKPKDYHIPTTIITVPPKQYEKLMTRSINKIADIKLKELKTNGIERWPEIEQKNDNLARPLAQQRPLSGYNRSPEKQVSLQYEQKMLLQEMCDGMLLVNTHTVNIDDYNFNCATPLASDDLIAAASKQRELLSIQKIQNAISTQLDMPINRFQPHKPSSQRPHSSQLHGSKHHSSKSNTKQYKNVMCLINTDEPSLVDLSMFDTASMSSPRGYKRPISSPGRVVSSATQNLNPYSSPLDSPGNTVNGLRRMVQDNRSPDNNSCSSVKSTKSGNFNADLVDNILNLDKEVSINSDYNNSITVNEAAPIVAISSPVKTVIKGSVTGSDKCTDSDATMNTSYVQITLNDYIRNNEDAKKTNQDTKTNQDNKTSQDNKSNQDIKETNQDTRINQDNKTKQKTKTNQDTKRTNQDIKTSQDKKSESVINTESNGTCIRPHPDSVPIVQKIEKLSFLESINLSNKSKLKKTSTVENGNPGNSLTTKVKTAEDVEVEMGRRRSLWIDLVDVVKSNVMVINKMHVLTSTLLGRGKFASVYKGSMMFGMHVLEYRINTAGLKESDHVAVKAVQFNSVKEVHNDDDLIEYSLSIPSVCLSEYLREIKALVPLSAHANVVRLHGVIMEPLSLVIEYMNRGNLYNYLSETDKQLSLKSKLQLMTDISSGLSYIHSKGYIHRDIKSHNIVLHESSDGTVIAKIADLGSCIENTGKISESCGTVGYMAPEVYVNLTYSYPIDVFSFSVVTWEVFSDSATRSNPLSSLDPDIACARLSEGLRPAIAPSCPNPVKACIESGWNYNPLLRPSMPKLHEQYQAFLQSKRMQILQSNTIAIATDTASPMPSPRNLLKHMSDMYTSVSAIVSPRK